MYGRFIPLGVLFQPKGGFWQSLLFIRIVYLKRFYKISSTFSKSEAHSLKFYEQLKIGIPTPNPTLKKWFYTVRKVFNLHRESKNGKKGLTGKVGDSVRIFLDSLLILRGIRADSEKITLSFPEILKGILGYQFFLGGFLAKKCSCYSYKWKLLLFAEKFMEKAFCYLKCLLFSRVCCNLPSESICSIYEMKLKGVWFSGGLDLHNWTLQFCSP